MKTKTPAVQSVVHSEEAASSAANPPTRAAGDFTATRSASLLPPVQLIQIAATVAAQFDLTVPKIHGRRRTLQIAWPRQIAMFLGYESGRSHHTVGQWWNRDHGTSIHSCRIVRDRMDVYPEVRTLIHRLAKSLNIPLSSGS